MADGKVIIDTALNNKGFVKGLNRMERQTNGLAVSMKKLGGIIASVFAVRELVNFGKECVELGSNVQEVQNVVDVAFGDMSYKIEDFAKTSIQNFGMSRLAAKKTASTYMAMAKGVGMADEAASDMAINLTGLTGDVASFFNISQELADIKLKSVFTGETETLKDLGVVMTQANLKAYALSKGMIKSYETMSQAEQVALRYNFVMDQLKLAHGDFIRTQDSWANQTRILSMQWQEFMSIIGQALVTVLTPLVKILNTIVSALINAANALNAFISSVFGGANTQIRQTEQNAAAVGGAIGESVENQDALTEATKETAKAQKKMLAGFDEVDKLAGDASGAAGAAGAGISSPGGLELNTTTTEADQKALKHFERLKAAIEPTVDALKRMWDVLQAVGSFAADGLRDFYETFLVPVGQWVMGEGLPRFIDAIANGLEKVDWQRINDALHILWEALAPFAINVGEGLLWLWENVLVPFGTWTMNEVVPLFIEGIAAALNLFNEIWESVQPGLEWFWNNFLQPVAEWAGGVVVDALQSFVDILRDMGDVVGGEMSFKDFVEGLSGAEISFIALAVAAGVVAAAFAIYNTVMAVAAIATAALSAPILLVVGAIAAVIAVILLCIKHWDDIKAAAVRCWENIVSAWQRASGWFNDTVVQPVSDFFSGLWEDVTAWASESWKKIKEVFGKVAQWVDDKIIQPVTTGFKGFVNGLIGFVESFVNFFIRGINRVIEAVNSMSFTVPDWVPLIGGNNFGFNLKKVTEVSLPRLAQGSVVPPNREFMAILGDNKRETEVVSPLSTMKQAFLETMQESGGSDRTITVVVNLDGKVVARNTVKHVNDMTRQAGKPVLLF